VTAAALDVNSLAIVAAGAAAAVWLGFFLGARFGMRWARAQGAAPAPDPEEPAAS
jgi:hypothetical protein